MLKLEFYSTSLMNTHYGATHHIRKATTISDTFIDVILVDMNDNIINYDKYPAPYAKNRYDITATIKLSLLTHLFIIATTRVLAQRF